MEEEHLRREADAHMNAPMRLVFVVCEGQTEETFVRDVLAPAFYPQLNLIGQLIQTSQVQKGGGLSYERVLRHLRNTLRRPSAPFVTTLFDLYQLDTDFPGRREATGKPLEQRLNLLNTGLHRAVVAAAGCQPNRFLPYIQPYEFEALLFSDVPTLTALEVGWSGAGKLQAIRDSAETPEHINDGPTTKPAAHLERHLTQPGYRKTLHGPIAVSLIGLPKIEQECRYFAAWLASLRELAALEADGMARGGSRNRHTNPERPPGTFPGGLFSFTSCLASPE